MIWDLPESLDVNGRAWDIRTDYRDILNILIAFEDPDLSPAEKQYVCLYGIYRDFDDLPADEYGEAYKAAISFIDAGKETNTKNSARTMDWEQDAGLLFPAVNQAAGVEVRALPYLHWWTFVGYFMEIHDSVYSTVLGLRQKKSKGKKLEKSETEFWNTNKDICVLKPKLTQEEIEEKERLKALLGGR